jgi:hypothetical protein
LSVKWTRWELYHHTCTPIICIYAVFYEYVWWYKKQHNIRSSFVIIKSDSIKRKYRIPQEQKASKLQDECKRIFRAKEKNIYYGGTIEIKEDEVTEKRSSKYAGVIIIYVYYIFFINNKS